MTDLTQDYQEIISEIEMTHDKDPWLILEGTSDEVFFNSIYKSGVKITSASGWENVVAVIDTSIKELSDKNVLGVIDKDFREVLSINETSEGIKIPSENIFETDNVDLENMLFHSEEAVNNVLLNFVKQSFTGTHEDIINHVVRETKKLSRFRYYCQFNNVDISLSDIEHSKFINEQLVFNEVKFINHLNGKNNGKPNLTIDDWNNAQSLTLPDPLSISERLCNGHDLLIILGISLRRLYGNHDKKLLDKLAIERSFRLAYPKSEFEKTLLYSSLSTRIA